MGYVEEEQETNEDSFNQLIGWKIDRVYITANHDAIVLAVGDVRFRIDHPQDCCEYAYIYHANQVDCLIGATIQSVAFLTYTEETDGTYHEGGGIAGKSLKELHEDGIGVDCYGFSFTTDKGVATFETRLESNGCYGGDFRVDEALSDAELGMVELTEDF